MDPIVERQVEVEATPEQVWSMLGQPAGWLADEGSLDLRPGGVGRLIEDGITRHAVVETVEHGRRLVYRWWDEQDDAARATRVEITVLPAGGPTRVTVRESPVAATASVASGVDARWDLRLLYLTWLTYLTCSSAVTPV